MTEINKLKLNKFAKSNEVSTNQQQQIVDQRLTTLTGITTSQINQALKAKKTNGLFPYPARVFLKVANQEQDIPVFFRIKYEKDSCQFHYGCPWYCNEEKSGWIRPKIKKGSHLQVEGYFSIGTIYTKQSERKSFTATSYQLLTQELNQQIETHGKQSLSK